MREVEAGITHPDEVAGELHEGFVTGLAALEPVCEGKVRGEVGGERGRDRLQGRLEPDHFCGIRSA
jgi:hypothetical protein